MRILLMVESACVGGRETAEAAARLGYTPVYLTQGTEAQGDTLAQMREHRSILCDTSSVPAMKGAVERALPGGASAVLSLSDPFLRNACDLASELGVQGMDPAIRALKDKQFVTRLLPEHSPPCMRFHAEEAPNDPLAEWLAKYGRLMLKPSMGNGGRVNLVVSKEDGADFFRSNLAVEDIPAQLAPEIWIAQPFVEGPLLSLEGYTAAGKPTYLGFSRRTKIGMSETQSLFPCDDELSPQLRERAYSIVEQLCTRGSFRFGYFQGTSAAPSAHSPPTRRSRAPVTLRYITDEPEADTRTKRTMRAISGRKPTWGWVPGEGGARCGETPARPVGTMRVKNRR